LDSIIITAAELLGQTVLSTTDHEGFSVTASLAASPLSQPIISFPVVQGMGMVTAVYSSGSVALYSSLSFGSISSPSQVGSTTRYTVTLLDGKTWAIYLTPSASGGAAPTLDRDPTGTLLRGPNGWSGIVQVAKLLSIGETALYDQQAGAYAVGGNITGTTTGSYSIAWQKEGDASKTLVQFALPHHMDSFAADTKAQASSVVLTALTKGTVTAIVADTWNLVEQLPTT
jgi:endo-1,3(4)-beta-glucanase